MTELNAFSVKMDERQAGTPPVQRALLAMRDMRAELEALRGNTDNRIAIVGMGCRFPGASGLDAFWEMLCNQRNGVTEVPIDRWDSARFFHPDAKAPGKIAGRWGGFLEYLDQFDASFFGISPREAPHVDPRQRKILEITWEALEDAGIPPLSLAGSATGVYIATLSSDYDTILCQHYGRISASTGTGTANSIIGNRLSYFLDLHGPSLTLDTACSGSLLTIELACRSLRSGECSLAMAGGASINLLPKGDVFFSAAGALSSTGSCKVFDAKADGIVRSEGAGIVILKRLSDALVDGDRIYAVIRGGAINHDGASNGIMAPNGEAQKRVLREAYRNAGVSPGDVQYIEAHGTGTPLGDPIEMSALASVLSEQRYGRPLMLGSLKTNVGHMEAAAGVGSVIKAALAIYRRTLLPNRQFDEWNPRMPEVPFPVEVLTEPRDWPANGARRVAGVSAFSFGGTNAHLVLEDAPELVPTEPMAESEQTFVFPISAKSPAALLAMIASYRAYLTSGANDSRLSDVCFTAGVRRSHHTFRFAAAASTLRELADKFANPGGNPRQVKKLAFVFSGQGSHWKGMGEGLLRAEPVFYKNFEACDRLFRQHTGWSVLEEISAGHRLDETDISQPAVFSMQIALLALWRSWGIEPDAVVGQSLGEIAAAYAAGAISLEAAVAVVHHRSRLMKTLAGNGKSAVVGLTSDAAREMIERWDRQLSIAGNSGPETTVISGSLGAISEMLKSLEEQGIFGQSIAGVDLALHGRGMQALRGDLENSLCDIGSSNAKTPMMSTVTGSWLNGSQPDAAYWGRNLCEPFQLADALRNLVREGFDAFLEISPHPLLGGAIREILSGEKSDAIVLGTCRRGETWDRTSKDSLAALYTAGRNVNWTAVIPERGRVVNLPMYPWQRERYWLDQLPRGSSASGEGSGGHPLLGSRIESALPGGQLLWEQEIDLTSPYYLSGHKVFGATVFPAAGYVESVFAALRQVGDGSGALDVSDLRFHEAMVLSSEVSQHLQVAFSAAANGSYDFQISARQNTDAPWTNHATGRARIVHDTAPTIVVSEIRQRCQENIDGEQHYDAMAAQGLEYSANFRALTSISRRRGEAIAKLELDPAAASDAESYCVHPILIDATLQVVAATIEPDDGSLYSRESYIPRGFRSLRFYRSPGATAICTVQLKEGQAGDREIFADIQLIDGEGKTCLAIEGLRLEHVGAGRVGAPGKLSDWLYEIHWKEKPRILASGSSRPESWTIFADLGGFGAQITESLRRRGLDCTLVAPGDANLPAVPAEGGVGVLDLRGLDNAENPCDVPLRLVQELATQGRNDTKLWFVTRGTQAIDGEVRILSPAAELWGFARVVALEHPEMKGGILDIGGSPEDVENVAEEILAPDVDRQLAFRNGKRLVPRLQSVSQSGRRMPVVFRSDATYMITGGLGGLGLALANWMVERGARRFILAGRTPLPPRHVWQTLTAGDTAKPKVEGIRELEQRGASVHIATFDVANEEEVRSYLQTFEAEGWPTIRGLIHAAGVVEDQFMLRLDKESFARVMRPKVGGAMALHYATLSLNLDFFTLFSSISSVFGQYGQAHYAAGNAFLDHFAHWRRACGLPAMSINWGPWADVGLFARQQTTDKTGRSGVFSMLPEQALRAMEHVQASALTEAIIVSADWSRMPSSPLFSDLSSTAAHSVDTAKDEQSATAMLLELLLAEPEDRRKQLENYLTVLAARVLNLDPDKLDPKEPLTAVGMDSIMVVELKHHIEKNLNLSVGIVDLFTGSISKLAEQLEGKLANDKQLESLLEQVENMSPDELEALLADTTNH